MSATISRPPLPFCALRFLIQWQQRERAIHATFQGTPRAKAFHEALSYFGLSRTFKGIGNPLELERARRIFAAACSDYSSSAEDQVIALAKSFKNSFGKYNVSAASKLLWLTHRSPFVILDTRAARGLKRITGERFRSNNYKDYTAVWRHLYKKRHAEIAAAVDLLPKARAFMPDFRQSKRELRQLCSAEWFRERVLDIYLWEAGDDD